MFDFPAFDVAIGLIFLYVVLALVCSTVNEALATAIGLRARYLETGLLNLLSGSVSETPAGIATAEKFYAHPLVQGLIRPRRAPDPAGDAAAARRGPWSRLKALFGKPPYPSYIPSRTFVTAVTDIGHEARTALETAQGDEADKARARAALAAGDLERTLASIPNAQLSEALLALYRQAGGDAVRFQRAAEEWFDDAMERVSGWYKRRVHVILAVIATVVVVLLNADTLAAGKVLWRDDAVRAAVVKEANDTAQGTLDDVALEKAVKKLDLPLGWELSFGDAPTQVPNDVVAWVQKVLGLLLTVGAIQLGAPFWFDLLSKIVRVRSTGAPPPASDAVRRGEGEETRRGPVETVEGGAPASGSRPAPA
ncbi:MAG: hypothetical protein M3265_04990 [Actinomycetota bacterium]|nr:hypothetical protein [Actinomycetota bacterium]